MSFLKYLLEYSKDYMPPSIAWRDRRVWNRTPTGKMHFVKIKSLTPEEQQKYKPIDLIRKDQRSEKLDQELRMPRQQDMQQLPQEEQPQMAPTPEKPKIDVQGEMFDFYYGVKDLNKYNEFEEDELVEATLDSARAIDMEDDEGLHVVLAKQVPVDAVKEYMDEEGDWKPIEITDKDKKAEFIKFGENDYFKIDLFAYQNVAVLELVSEDDQEKIDDQLEKEVTENIKNYERYIIEKEIQFLIDNKVIVLIEDYNLDNFDPKIVAFAKKIAHDLGVIFKGFWGLPNKKEAWAEFVDEKTKGNFTIPIPHIGADVERAALDRLEDLRNKMGVAV